MDESEDAIDPDVSRTIGELHEMFSSTREGLDNRKPTVEMSRRFIGKN